MSAGKIKKIVYDKGYGFIQTDGAEDVFFHHTSVAEHGFDQLVEGQDGEYSVEAEPSTKGKGPRATSVAAV